MFLHLSVSHSVQRGVGEWGVCGGGVVVKGDMVKVCDVCTEGCV